MGRALGFLVCAVAVLLPWRCRILFAEALGWVTQFLYFTYYGIFNYVLSELRDSEGGSAGLRENSGRV